MTTPQHSIPCAYAKAIMAVLAIIVGLALYGIGEASAAQKESQENRNSITELRTDIRYIREAVTELRNMAMPRKP